MSKDGVIVGIVVAGGSPLVTEELRKYAKEVAVNQEEPILLIVDDPGAAPSMYVCDGDAEAMRLLEQFELEGKMDLESEQVPGGIRTVRPLYVSLARVQTSYSRVAKIASMPP